MGMYSHSYAGGGDIDSEAGYGILHRGLDRTDPEPSIPNLDYLKEELPYKYGSFILGATILQYATFDDTDAGIQALQEIIKGCELPSNPGMYPTRYRLAGLEDDVFDEYRITLLFAMDAHQPETLRKMGAAAIDEKPVNSDADGALEHVAPVVELFDYRSRYEIPNAGS